MGRCLIAWIFCAITILLAGAIVVVGIVYLPRQTFVDYLIEADVAARDPKLVDFLIDTLREMLMHQAVALTVGILFASFIWFIWAGFARIQVPGDAARNSWAWWGIAGFVATGVAVVVAVLCFSDANFDILRLETRWVLPVIALPVSAAVYWISTAIWTPSLQAPAVLFGEKFGWIRRPFSL